MKEGPIPRFLLQTRVHPGTHIITGEAVQPIHPDKVAHLLQGPEAMLLLQEEALQAVRVILPDHHTHREDDLHRMAEDLIHPAHLREGHLTPQAVLPQAVLPAEDGNIINKQSLI